MYVILWSISWKTKNSLNVDLRILKSTTFSGQKSTRQKIHTSVSSQFHKVNLFLWNGHVPLSKRKKKLFASPHQWTSIIYPSTRKWIGFFFLNYHLLQQGGFCFATKCLDCHFVDLIYRAKSHRTPGLYFWTWKVGSWGGIPFNRVLTFYTTDLVDF